MPIAPWRLNLQPASFNGVPFKVDADTRGSGRRLVPHEFPKRDTPWTEDMGRRARRFIVVAYVIQSPDNGFDYRPNRDDLIAALEALGPGTLVHPTLGQDVVEVDEYKVTERRELGGYAEFEINFIEAGQQAVTSPFTDTVSAAVSAARSAIGSFQNSSDITALARG
jgi:prophage DNA circulation protein